MDKSLTKCSTKNPGSKFPSNIFIPKDSSYLDYAAPDFIKLINYSIYNPEECAKSKPSITPNKLFARQI